MKRRFSISPSLKFHFLLASYMLLILIPNFSIIATELKGENIYTVESLNEKISCSPINPRPICQELVFIYDWKKYVTPNLATPQLSQHTRFNSFLITFESELPVFRYIERMINLQSSFSYNFQSQKVPSVLALGP